jgi:hypothetical protein
MRALRRIYLRRRLEEVQQALQRSESAARGEKQALLQEKVRLKRALMDPGLGEGGSCGGYRKGKRNHREHQGFKNPGLQRNLSAPIKLGTNCPRVAI